MGKLTAITNCSVTRVFSVDPASTATVHSRPHRGSTSMKLLLFTVCVAVALAVVLAVDLPMPGNPKDAHAACRFTCFRTFIMNKVMLSRVEGEEFTQMDTMVDIVEKKIEKCFSYCDKIPH
ncbi:hypothetical protein LSAT2_020384 [Lamellibrachia satsuma]|nr:hypothetical protein LSAT2_020384 [Lamellibrachia satsuma]